MKPALSASRFGLGGTVLFSLVATLPDRLGVLSRQTARHGQNSMSAGSTLPSATRRASTAACLCPLRSALVQTCNMLVMRTYQATTACVPDCPNMALLTRETAASKHYRLRPGFLPKLPNAAVRPFIWSGGAVPILRVGGVTFPCFPPYKSTHDHTSSATELPTDQQA